MALQFGVVDDVCLIADAPSLGGRYDALVEVTGSMEAAEHLAECALPEGGNIYSYAVYEGMTADGFFEPLSRRWSFSRANPAEATAHEDVVEMLRSGEFDPQPFVTGRYGFSEWEAAWRSVTERTSLKTIIFAE